MIAFPTRAKLESWLRKHHKTEKELWVRIYKKDSGTPSVTWEDCVVAGIAWGWIDGHKKSLDTVSFLQRMTPRRPKSGWSKKNTEHAERLIAEGRMQKAGLEHVEAARADGRWSQAYAGSKDMVIPEDFVRALKRNRRASAFYKTLNRANQFAIYHRLATAKTEATRTKRIESILARLESGKAFH